MFCNDLSSLWKEIRGVFPNVKQENLSIGMIHAFLYMGIPKYILIDNMKGVVIRRVQRG